MTMIKENFWKKRRFGMIELQMNFRRRKIIEIFVDGTLNSEKLILGASEFFPSEIWTMLSDIAKNDLNDACNCLLTKSWTPSVMISLRAAEDCIRRFYEFKTGKKTKNKGRKDILEELEKLGSVNKNIIGYLNYLRGIRNMSEHPDEIFDQLEAERVFHQVVNMIHVINKEMFLTRPFDKLSLNELKCILKIKNLKISGKKEDLIKRVEENGKTS